MSRNNTLQDLQLKVEHLSEQLSFLTLQIQDILQSQQQETTETPNQPHRTPRSGPQDFRLGDSVEITNRYRNKKGRRVRIKHIQGDRIYFDLDDKYTWRLRKNLKRITL